MPETFMPAFRETLDRYLETFDSLVIAAGVAGFDRRNEVEAAHAAADNLEYFATLMGVSNISKLLSAPNAPRMTVMGEEEGTPVVLKLELGPDEFEAAMLKVYNAQNKPAPKLYVAMEAKSPDGKVMHAMKMEAIGDGRSLSGYPGSPDRSVETDFATTKLLIDLSRLMRLAPVRGFGRPPSIDEHLAGAFEVSMALLERAGEDVGFSMPIARRAMSRLSKSSPTIINGSFNANNIVSDPKTGELKVVDPFALRGPIECEPSESIAQSQILGAELDALIAYAAEDPALSEGALKIGVGTLLTNYAGYGIGNDIQYQQNPSAYRKPTHPYTDLLGEGRRLTLAGLDLAAGLYQ